MFDEMFAVIPNVTFVPEYDPVGFPGIKALFFDGADMVGKKTKFFAYMGFPESASKDSPVPAMVLQHGGGGYAFPEWVRVWNSRGYAAIAVSNTGYKPATLGMTDFYSASSWTKTLTAQEMAEDERVLTPDNDSNDLNAGELTQQWLYHAVGSCILAYNILHDDERVNRAQIGLTGISWGGVITSIAMGYDNRFNFFIPVYGCAFLWESQTWMKNHFSPKACERWDAAKRLSKVRAPILWLNGAEDTAFDTHCSCKSYLTTKENSVFALRLDMEHGHWQGWVAPEIYRFADWVIGRGEKMTTLSVLPDVSMGRKLDLTLDLPSDALEVTAKLHYLTALPVYMGDQQWAEHFKSVDCIVDIMGKTLHAEVPAHAALYYIEVYTAWEDSTYSTSSPVITIANET